MIHAAKLFDITYSSHISTTANKTNNANTIVLISLSSNLHLSGSIDWHDWHGIYYFGSLLPEISYPIVFHFMDSTLIEIQVVTFREIIFMLTTTALSFKLN